MLPLCALRILRLCIHWPPTHSCIDASIHASTICIWLQADTPEAMLREMLEMSNLELQLRSQLAEEAEGRYQRTISEQQAILGDT